MRFFSGFSRVIVLALSTALVGSASAAAQNEQGSAAVTQTRTVQLRIRLDLPDRNPAAPARSTILQIQPLDGKSAPGTAHVSEGATTVVTLPSGRYQISSSTPVTINGHSSGWDVEVPVTSSETELELSQQNAVRISPFGQAEPETSAQSRSENQGTTQPIDSQTQAQIQDLLNRWVESLKAHNLDAQMSCYAPVLSRYFLKEQVSRKEVRRDKEHFLQRYPEIRSLALRDVKVSSVGGELQATAIKSWDFGGQKDWTGQVLTHLKFEGKDGKWLISSERERLIKESVPFKAGSAQVAGGPDQ